MDRYSRLTFRAVLLAFCLMFAAVMRVNSSFNTIVQPSVATELIHTAELKRELLRYGEKAVVMAMEQAEVIKEKVQTVEKQGQQVQEMAQLAQDRAWDWWCRVWEDNWENVAAKKQEKNRN